MWEDLSIKEKAELIKQATKSGLRGIEQIRDAYNNSIKQEQAIAQAQLEEQQLEEEQNTEYLPSPEESNYAGDSDYAEVEDIIQEAQDNIAAEKYAYGGELDNSGGISFEDLVMSRLYADGGNLQEVVITPDYQYNQFLNTLPANQRLTPESEYTTHRYWELNDKPRDFEEAKKLGMYHYNPKDKSYHANSVMPNKDTGDIEFMKPAGHPTLRKELEFYLSPQAEDFRKHYRLDTSTNPYRYVPRVFAGGGKLKLKPKPELDPMNAFNYNNYNKGININSNKTVGKEARRRGLEAKRYREQQKAERVAEINSQNEMHTLVPVTSRSGEVKYVTQTNPKVIGLSPVDPIGEFVVGNAIASPIMNRAFGIMRNLTPQNLRNHWYVSKPPIGYGGVKDAVKRQIKGVLSGKKADIDNPWWFNSESAKQLENYAYVPDYITEIEKREYLKQFGKHALEARADAWRMHNLIPQKFNTFTENPRHPGSFTDIEGIRKLKWIPPQVQGEPQVDFVNSVGGNVGIPTITNLGAGIPDKGVIAQNFGVTTTSDLFDLHPFSRTADKLRPRIINPIWNNYILKPTHKMTHKIYKAVDPLRYDVKAGNDWLSQANDMEVDFFDPDMFPKKGISRYIGDVIAETTDKINDVVRLPKFKSLESIENRMSNLEVGDITGGKPFLVQYDIPWTSKTTYVNNLKNHLGTERTERTLGFNSENILPKQVRDWRKK